VSAFFVLMRNEIIKNWNFMWRCTVMPALTMNIDEMQWIERLKDWNFPSTANSAHSTYFISVSNAVQHLRLIEDLVKFEMHVRPKKKRSVRRRHEKVNCALLSVKFALIQKVEWRNFQFSRFNCLLFHGFCFDLRLISTDERLHGNKYKLLLSFRLEDARR
jgi:hypothetical protein